MLVQRVRASAVDAADALNPAVGQVLKVENPGVHIGNRLCVDREVLKAHTRHRKRARPPRTRTLSTPPVRRIQSRSNPDSPGTIPGNRSHDHLLILRPSRSAIMRATFLRTGSIG